MTNKKDETDFNMVIDILKKCLKEDVDYLLLWKSCIAQSYLDENTHTDYESYSNEIAHKTVLNFLKAIKKEGYIKWQL